MPSLILTREILQRSVTRKPFGTFEPFITGHPKLVASFYHRALASVELTPGLSLLPEPDHHGGGYASYVSAFVSPASPQDAGFDQRAGVLLYLSRLASVAVFGAATLHPGQTIRAGIERKNAPRPRFEIGTGLLRAAHVNTLPEPGSYPQGTGGNWSDFTDSLRRCLARHQIEFLPRDALLHPAPLGLSIPTSFAPPHYVFDALYYWKAD